MRTRAGFLLGLTFTLLAGGTDEVRATDGTRPPLTSTSSKELPSMQMTFGAQRFVVTLEDNPTARAFAKLLPMTLDMPDLNGNEKHVRLPSSLPTSAMQPGTIRTGDVMLYGNDTLVVFYKTFRSSYSYTRIGRITDSSGLADALGAGSQRISFAVR